MNITSTIRKILLGTVCAILGFFALSIHAETTWTTTDVEPASWTALPGNLIDGLTGTRSGSVSTGYGTDSMAVLTDGVVPTVNGNESRVAFQSGSSVEWSFTTPKTLEEVRVSGCYLGGSTYTRISISAVYVKPSGSDTWTELDGSSFLDNSGRNQNVVICASLADPSTGYLAHGVAGLKVAFGANVPLASYIVEIEAIGSAEATGPVLGAFDLSPAKTKAMVSGTISDVGSDASACDIYLALDGGAAVKIVEGVSGSFGYQIRGLTAGTSYSYELSVSNNAPTIKGTVRSGTFTTLAADAQTASWTTEDVAPSSWTALSNNLLAGLTGATSGQIATGFSTNDPDLLTDATVPTEAGAAYIVGFQNSASIEWTFNKQKTLESLRVSVCYLAGNAYTRLAISGVYVKLANSDTWDALDVPTYSDIGGRNQSVILCASLSDSEAGYLSQGVVGLKITFGNVGALASYCAEIEAVGFTEATGPVIGSFDITPVKTKARFAGSIADPGSDATACDVYLSVGGTAARKIASGITGSFDYQAKNLTAGTTYSYELCVSNNAPTARGTVRSGTFTTLAADAQTASWTQGEYATADWTALAGNILSNLVATETYKVSPYASQDMAKLTDGSVPNPAAGAETVGFQPDGTISWTFGRPMTIETLRISSLWESTLYNGISVNAIQVKLRGSTEWEALEVPTVQWTGGTQFGQTETLSDLENGCLARNVVGLKIVFGAQKAAVANYYAEIEAVGHPSGEDISPLIISVR